MKTVPILALAALLAAGCSEFAYDPAKAPPPVAKPAPAGPAAAYPSYMEAWSFRRRQEPDLANNMFRGVVVFFNDVAGCEDVVAAARADACESPNKP